MPVNESDSESKSKEGLEPDPEVNRLQTKTKRRKHLRTEVKRNKNQAIFAKKIERKQNYLTAALFSKKNRNLALGSILLPPFWGRE